MKPDPGRDSLVIDSEVERQELVDRFEMFKSNAYTANLGKSENIGQKTSSH